MIAIYFHLEIMIVTISIFY